MKNERESNVKKSELEKKTSTPEIKKKYVVIAITIICILIVVVACIGIFSNKNNGGSKNNNLFKNNENQIARSYNTLANDLQEKKFTITPFESGEIVVKTNIQQGKINITITDGIGNIVFSENEISMQNNNQTIVQVPEGNGTYTARIDTEEFIGSWDVSWNTKNIDARETFLSDQGYELQYEPTKFKHEKNESGDLFTLIETTTHSHPESVYLRIQLVEASNVEKVKETIFTSEVIRGDCIIAGGKLTGEYALKEIEVGSDTFVNRTCTVMLDDGRMLVAEVCFYGNAFIGEASSEEIRLSNMIESIIIK